MITEVGRAGRGGAGRGGAGLGAGVEAMFNVFLWRLSGMRRYLLADHLTVLNMTTSQALDAGLRLQLQT